MIETWHKLFIGERIAIESGRLTRDIAARACGAKIGQALKDGLAVFTIRSGCLSEQVAKADGEDHDAFLAGFLGNCFGQVAGGAIDVFPGCVRIAHVGNDVSRRARYDRKFVGAAMGVVPVG